MFQLRVRYSRHAGTLPGVRYAGLVNIGSDSMIRRRLFNIASAVSLLLCMGVVMLWIHSYSDGYMVLWRQQDRGIEFVTCTGRMLFTYDRILQHDKYSFVGFHHGRMFPDIRWERVIPSSRLYLGSFAAGSNHVGGSLLAYCVILPYWLFVVLTAAAPICWLIARRRRLQSKRGFDVLSKAHPAD